MANKKEKHNKKSAFDDPKTMSEFRDYIIAGNTVTEACYLVGAGKSTWYDYVKKHPEYRTKFKRWKHALSARAKLLIAKAIMNDQDVGMATYVLEREQKLEKARAESELTRAKAKQIKVQTSLAERQLEQINDTADSVRDSMAQLDVETLKKLAHLDDGIDIDASDE